MAKFYKGKICITSLESSLEAHKRTFSRGADSKTKVSTHREFGEICFKRFSFNSAVYPSRSIITPFYTAYVIT